MQGHTGGWGQPYRGRRTDTRMGGGPRRTKGAARGREETNDRAGASTQRRRRRLGDATRGPCKAAAAGCAQAVKKGGLGPPLGCSPMIQGTGVGVGGGQQRGTGEEKRTPAGPRRPPGGAGEWDRGRAGVGRREAAGWRSRQPPKGALGLSADTAKLMGAGHVSICGPLQGRGHQKRGAVPGAQTSLFAAASALGVAAPTRRGSGGGEGDEKGGCCAAPALSAHQRL
jgi:hypothetical protein